MTMRCNASHVASVTTIVTATGRTPNNTSEGAHSAGSWNASHEIAREAARSPVQPALPTMEVAR